MGFTMRPAKTTVNSRDFLDHLRTLLLVHDLRIDDTKIDDHTDWLVVVFPDGVRFKVRVDEMPPVLPKFEQRLAQTILRYREFLGEQFSSDQLNVVFSECEQGLLADDDDEMQRVVHDTRS